MNFRPIGGWFRYTARLCAVLALSGPIVIQFDGSPASAGCQGTNNSFPLYEYWGREEAQYSSTCDWDTIYAGKVQDNWTDGYCVDAIFVDDPWIGGYPTNHYQGTACTSSWAYYSYYDPTPDSYTVAIVICRGALGCSDDAHFGH